MEKYKFYKHFKNRDLYFVVGSAFHTENKERLVLYKKCGQDEIYARPVNMFYANLAIDAETYRQRFEKVFPTCYKNMQSDSVWVCLNKGKKMTRLCNFPANRIFLISNEDLERDYREVNRSEYCC